MTRARSNDPDRALPVSSLPHDALAHGALPRSIGRTATAALTLAGYDRLERLDGASAGELLRLHGVGPAAITRLRDALAASGRSFRD